MSKKPDERRFRGRCVACNDIAYLTHADAIANKGRIFPPEIGRLVFKPCPRGCGLWIVDHIEPALAKRGGAAPAAEAGRERAK